MFFDTDASFSMKKNEVEKVLNIYKLFIRETDALISLYSNLSLYVPHIPHIRRAKTSLIDVLQNHIDKMDDSNYDSSSLPFSYTEMNTIIENPFSESKSQNILYNDDEDESSEDEDESSSSSYDDDEDESSSSSSEDVTVSRIGSDVQFSSDNHSWYCTTEQQQRNYSTTSHGWDIFDNVSISESPSFTSTTFSDKFYTDPFNTSLESTDSFSYDKQGSTSQVTSPELKTYRERANSVKSLVNQLYISQSQSHIPDNPFFDSKTVNSNETKSSNPFINETDFFKWETQQEKKFNPFL